MHVRPTSLLALLVMVAATWMVGPASARPKASPAKKSAEGGDRVDELRQAVQAADTTAVQQSLAAGADPWTVDRADRSVVDLALANVRPSTAEVSEILRLLLAVPARTKTQQQARQGWPRVLGATIRRAAMAQQTPCLHNTYPLSRARPVR